MTGFQGQPEEELPKLCVVGFKPKCGHAVSAWVLSIDQLPDIATMVAKPDGLIFEFRSVQWAQKHLTICECK